MLSLLLASAMITATPQDAPLTADRVTYDQLVDCAATFVLQRRWPMWTGNLV
jgi:hypothetical protein